jgi:hypothetical protein
LGLLVSFYESFASGKLSEMTANPTRTDLTEDENMGILEMSSRSQTIAWL